MFIFIPQMISIINWNEKKDNYLEQYVYSEFGTLYYEVNEERVYVQSIYNTDNEKITLNIPNNKIIILYINKNNINEGIYFNLETNDQSILEPTGYIFVEFLMIGLGVFFVLINKESKEKKITLKPIFLSSVCFFSMGVFAVISQLINAVNYFELKNENNITTATIFSEIYDIGAENNSYNPVSYYYVDNQKYIYVNDSYVDGKLEDNIGKTFELY